MAKSRDRGYSAFSDLNAPARPILIRRHSRHGWTGPVSRVPGRWPTMLPRNGEKPGPRIFSLFRSERACKADPHPEAFQAWLDWARKQGPWQVADNVAEEWRKAGTADIQPLQLG